MTACLSPATQDLCPSIVPPLSFADRPVYRVISSVPPRTEPVRDTREDTVADWRWGMSGFG